MPETQTPGQVNYEAYCRAMQGTVMVPWRTVMPESRCAWEAAAEAVLQAAAPAPLFRFALGQPVQVRGDAALYTIHSRGCESTARGRDLVWYRLTRDGAVCETVGDDVLTPAGPPDQEDTPHA